MLNSIDKANQNENQQDDSEKMQQEMTSSINEANGNAQPAIQDEQDQKAQDMLEAINEANK